MLTYYYNNINKIYFIQFIFNASQRNYQSLSLDTNKSEFVTNEQ